MRNRDYPLGNAIFKQLRSENRISQKRSRRVAVAQILDVLEFNPAGTVSPDMRGFRNIPPLLESDKTYNEVYLSRVFHLLNWLRSSDGEK